MHPPSTGLPESMENYSGGALTPPVMSSKKNWSLISSDAALKSKWATEAIANSYFIT
jgi:hypothetical protein